jgi:HPt (histidine-containing phosphotransfer) domain-containing protein
VTADLTPILDVAALQRQTGGDVRLQREIVQMFLEDCPLRIDEIGAALAQGDLAAVVSSSHALKGSAAYMKASIVRDRSADLETAAREGRHADAAARLNELRAAVGRLLPELEKLIA